MYHTNIYYCGDLFLTRNIETVKDLWQISGRTYYTKDYKYEIKLPNFFNMLTYFYGTHTRPS